MYATIPARLQFLLLKAWHAWLAGGFLVAWLTADEDTYAMHQFAGYAVLAAIVVRIAAGLLAGSNGPLRLPRPSGRALRGWLAAALLTAVGIVAFSGAIADATGWLEKPHEAIAESSLWLILGHIAYVAWQRGIKRWLR
jgi:cytochrome b